MIKKLLLMLSVLIGMGAVSNATCTPVYWVAASNPSQGGLASVTHNLTPGCSQIYIDVVTVSIGGGGLDYTQSLQLTYGTFTSLYRMGGVAGDWDRLGNSTFAPMTLPGVSTSTLGFTLALATGH